MSSLREDTFNSGLRVGREEGRAEERKRCIDVIITLVTEKNWSIEEAMDLFSVSDDMDDPIRAELYRRLGR